MKNTSFNKWARLIAQFATGQVCIQILNLITGLLLLRWLSVLDYAKYGLAFSFQTAIISLVDLGFGGSIIALVGERGNDKEVVGSYVRSAQFLRNRLTLLGILVTCIAFPLLAYRQGWSIPSTLLLLASIITTILFQYWMIYASPLLIRGRLNDYYSAQIVAAVVRLGIGVSLYLTIGLSAWSAAWLGTLALCINGAFYRKRAAPFISEPKQHSPQSNREMLGYLTPLMPSIIFSGLQGQITMGLIALFGKTQNVAEVAALGRLGQMFLILSAFNSVVVEPFIARVSQKQFARRYVQLLISAIILGCVITFLAFAYPEPLQWVMGPKYKNLKTEASWSVMVACISYVSGMMWTMHSARKWVFWWASFCYIGVLLTVQAICIMTMKLSHTMDILHFSVITSLALLFVHSITAVYGFFVLPYQQQKKDGASHLKPETVDA